MKDLVATKDEPSDQITGAFAELERGVHAALETQSNVHRDGHGACRT
jgi:uncharacterized protein YwbE